MVCEKCEAKLSKVIVPDKWKDGARNTIGGKDGGQSVGAQNMALRNRSKSKRYSPMDTKCRICKSKLSQHAHYCQQCAYKKGICAVCGRKMLNTKEYKMSS